MGRSEIPALPCSLSPCVRGIGPIALGSTTPPPRSSLQDKRYDCLGGTLPVAGDAGTSSPRMPGAIACREARKSHLNTQLL